MGDADHLEDFGREERPPCQLYLISPPAFDPQAHAAALGEALSGGEVAAYQLRLKGVDDAAVLTAAAVLLPICRQADVAFILNDRADLAKAAGADGLHLGQTDGSLADARRLLGAEAQIGVTCHDSRHLAMEAGEGGANYVAFGAFFPTSTKTVEHMAEPEILRWWTALSPIPCVAIGGITAENCAPLVRAGADFLAVSAAVWAAADGPAAAVRRFAEAMRTA
ncbi:thiamine phosphate synthase [Sandaracinobacter sp. RS1-74]|uniref:thiamine phosphate synthase n=1 Tax=Sandaracinobacteroides sayramensis TaxID=2913411 RepID=UPI001EDA69ED|nr:thiamine phosphate synthase [Sandaracinobacteroides sayramensis]MCG2842405.1 thiamine phosphate synthase [Sandaracinobacteroides sayramensis]